MEFLNVNSGCGTLQTRQVDGFINSKTVERSFNDKKVKFIISPENHLTFKVYYLQKWMEIPSTNVQGIPESLKNNVQELENFLTNASFHLNSVKEGQKLSFAVHLYASALGGGNSGSKDDKKQPNPNNNNNKPNSNIKINEVNNNNNKSELDILKDQYSAANSLSNKNLHAMAIKAYEKTIDLAKKLDQADSVEKEQIGEILRDSYYGLGLQQQLTKDLENALANLNEASKLGKDEAKQKSGEIHVILAERQKNNPQIQNEHLITARDLGNAAAIEKLKEMERITIIETPEDEILADDIIYRMISRPWSSGYQLGRGINADGNPTIVVVKNIAFQQAEVIGSEQTFEYLISNQNDVSSLTKLGANAAIGRGMWHLKATAEFAKNLKLSDQFVYAIIVTAYLSPYQDVFLSGSLNDNCLRYLQREGLEKFKKLYGSHFVGGSSKGALFIGCFKLAAKSQEDGYAIRVGIKGTVAELLGAGPGIERDKSKLIEEKLQEIHVHTIGIKTPLKDTVKSLDDLRSQHTQFRTLIADPANLGPAQAICEPWHTLDEISACLLQAPETTSLSLVLKNTCKRCLEDESARTLTRLYTPLKSVSQVQKMNAEGQGTDLFNQLDAFRKGNKKVFLLLGEAGGGKSYFLRHIEQTLWNEFDPDSENSIIPIRIELNTLVNPIHEVVEQYLKRQGYTEDQIQELKHRGRVFLILDGYDEGRYENKPLNHNLYMTNQLKDWKGKVVISGRLDASDALNPRKQDHLKLFAPVEDDRIRTDLVEEAFICPFFQSERKEFLKKFVTSAPEELKAEHPAWFENEGVKFTQTFSKIAGLEQLIQTPFALRMMMEVLPRIVKDHNEDLSQEITQADIFKCFAATCIEREASKYLKAGRPFPLEFDGQDLNAVSTEFCRQVASAMSKRNTLSLVNIPGQLDMDDCELLFSDTADAEFIKAICSDLVRKSSVFEEGEYCDQYSFLHSNLRDYFLSLPGVEEYYSADEKD
jgi:hypothetical protein